MPRLMGINLPEEKRIDYALTLIHGVGWSRSVEILKKSVVEASLRVKNLTEEQLKKITTYIDKSFKVEGDLREERSEDIKRLREIGCYRGIRHRLGLPVRGQRTRSNARTKRGKRRTVGALSKEAWSKVDQVQTQGSSKTAPVATTVAVSTAPAAKASPAKLGPAKSSSAK